MFTLNIDEMTNSHNRYLLLCVVAVLFISCTQPKQPIADEEAIGIMNDLFTSLAEADTSLLLTISSEDFYLFEHDEIWNTDSLLSLMPYTQGRIWELKDFKIEKEGDLVHISYFNESQNPLGRSWLESALLRKEEDGLKIQFLHSTKLYLNQ